MPTYDYNCKACGHTLEASQSIKAEPLRECPNCQKQTLQRGFGGGSATFRFKGSGFYLTDYCKSKDPVSKEKCPCNTISEE